MTKTVTKSRLGLFEIHVQHCDRCFKYMQKSGAIQVPTGMRIGGFKQRMNRKLCSTGVTILFAALFGQ